MAQSNFLRKMKNVDMSKKGNRVDRNKKDSQNFRIIIDLSRNDQKRLNKLMGEELRYFNSLVEAFSGISRSFPERLLDVTEKHEKMFMEIAYTQFDLKKIVNTTNVDLPERLKKFEDILLGKDKNNKRLLTDRLLIFLEIAASPGRIHPQVRKNMAYEILKFYQEQARTRKNSENLMLKEQEFKGNPLELEVQDSLRKRHVQIPRSICQVEWDENEQESYIYTPYTNSAISFPGVNLKNEQWSVAIIHQEPGCIPKSDTPWSIDIKSHPVSYFVNYLELNSPYIGSAFHQAKGRIGS